MRGSGEAKKKGMGRRRRKKKKVVASISECFNNVKHDELKEILDLLLKSFDILRQESSKLPE